MEYKIVSVKDSLLEYGVECLEKVVSMLTEEGWQLQGGVSIAKHDDVTYTLVQAMVKYPTYPIINME